MTQQRLQHLPLRRRIINGGKLPFRLHEDLPEDAGQTEVHPQIPPVRRPAGIVTSQALRVQPVQAPDPGQPLVLPVIKVATRRRRLDEIPPDMGPAECQDQLARRQAGQLLVGAIAIAYQDHALAQPSEQGRGGRRAARCIDMQIHCIHAGRDPQPGAAGRARRGELPDPPAGLVGVDHRRLLEMLKDRRRQRRKQHHHPTQPVRKRSR